MKISKNIFVAALLSLLPLTGASGQQPTPVRADKPRVIITCDPELDDLNSLIRFLLFSTDYRVEGLVYASSQYHWKGDGKGTRWYVPGREYSRGGMDLGPMESWRWTPGERFIDEAVEAYAEVYPCLKVHDAAYPTPEYLKSRIRVGNIEFDGEMSKDTPGSELIKAVLLDDVPGPVFVNAWGGASTIARALRSIQDIYEHGESWEEIRTKVTQKTILSLSGDQDDTYARYIKPFWPGIRVMEADPMAVGLVYNAQMRASEESRHYYSPEWMQQNIRSKGPLGAMYRVWGDGKQMVKGDKFDYFGLSGLTEEQLREQGYVVWTPVQPQGSFLAEGDTFCYLNLIDNGLRGHEDPTYGGWCGGRLVLPDSVSRLPRMEQMKYKLEHYPMPDFTAPVMNSLAARLQWSVTPAYKDANHVPQIEAPLSLTGRPGEILKIKCKVTDPDRNEVSLKWWSYVQACTYRGKVSVDNPTAATTTFTVPTDARPGDTIHLILEATDNGTPQQTRYHRLIVTVESEK